MALMRSFLQRGQALLQDSLIPLLARTGLAATFWLSGQ
ncbi:doxX domain protein, partial [Escherichia coli 6-319-05_S1_C1]